MSKLGKAKKAKPHVRKCWPHPLLEIKPGLPPIAGSACANPVVADYDIYIGFEKMALTSRHLPWTPGTEILYPIRDTGVPRHPETYGKLVDWTLEQMEGGARVHAGCIGGHGRTGMFFAALVAVATGRKDAIPYVREHYCKKACETYVQIDYLVKRFGVDATKASKSFSSGSPAPWPKSPYATGSHMGTSSQGGRIVHPIAAATTIWGDTLGFGIEDVDE